MRFIYVAAMLGMTTAGLVVGPPAHADTGVNGYVRCIGGDAKPPPPGVSAEDWFPSVHVIATDFNGGVPSAQIVQRLVDMGVAPNDAATQVRCFVANQPH